MRDRATVVNLFAISASCLLTWRHANAQVDYRIVVHPGQHVPGYADAVTFRPSPYYDVAINNEGHVAFFSPVSGPGMASNAAGIWRETATGLAAVAEVNQAIPGTSPVQTFSGLGGPVINDTGLVAFTGNSSAGSRGYWLGGSAALTILALSGRPAPGMGAQVVFGSSLAGDWSPALLNAAGELMFEGFATGPAIVIASGLWRGTGDSFGLVVAERNAAGGTPQGVIFQLSGIAGTGGDFFDVSMNGTGRALFSAMVTGPGVTTSNNVGIWSSTVSGTALVARNGDPVPGIIGATFRSVNKADQNSGGTIAFSAQITGAGVSSSTDMVVFCDRGSGGMRPLAREGDAAPLAGVELGDIGLMQLNSSDQIAMYAALRGAGVTSANDSAIMLDVESSRRIVVREGDLAPGTSAQFGDFGFDAVHINSAGQLALIGRLTGSGVNSGNDRGIWGVASNGEVHLLARTGDVIDIDPGPAFDWRTISSLRMDLLGSGGEDGQPRLLNELGQVAFIAAFADQTAAVLVATIPESPSCPACPADYDQDGGVTGGDIGAFFVDYEQGAGCADVDQDGGVTGADIGAFFVAYEAGGC